MCVCVCVCVCVWCVSRVWIRRSSTLAGHDIQVRVCFLVMNMLLMHVLDMYVQCHTIYLKGFYVHPLCTVIL